MKVDTYKKINITLNMTPEEALWLKKTLQNPVGPEGSEDFNLRKGFFEALPEFPKLEAMTQI